MSAANIPPVDAALLDEATELAVAAGRRTLRWFAKKDLVVDAKADATPVTVADRDAERFVRQQIIDRYPADTVIGEEEADLVGTSGRRWIVDPIDGTKAFIRGVPLYSTLLAVDDAHGPAVGVIVLPALDQVVAAGRGLGCFANGERCGVSDTGELRGSCVTSSGFRTWSESALRAVLDAEAVVRTWGDGYGYAMVATGRAEAMVDPIASLWDLAPMPVIITEAGGRFSTIDGERADADGGSGVASNAHVHDELLALLA